MNENKTQVLKKADTHKKRLFFNSGNQAISKLTRNFFVINDEFINLLFLLR